jgi:hypothetical protein
MFEIASSPIEQIDIQKIDLQDPFYQISNQNQLNLLCQSIQQMGVMHPPLLQCKGIKYRIICGFQRIFACKEMGKDVISSRVVKSDTPQHICAKWAVVDNTSQRMLTPLEQSRALTLIETTLPEHSSIHAVAQQIGLPATARAIQQIRPLCHMMQSIQQGIANEYIAIPIAHEITQLPENDAYCFAQLFENLCVGINIQRELLTTCTEIGKRDNKSITDILNSEPVQTIMEKYADDRKQRIHYIRSCLKELRYPHFSKLQQQVETAIKNLKLDQQTRLVPPPYFENNIWSLQIRFNTKSELNHCLADVSSKTDKINKIIEQDIHI